MIGEQRDPVRVVGVEVDAGEIAVGGAAAVLFPVLVPLEQEVTAIVVVGIRAAQLGQDQVGVLVGLGLGGFDVGSESRQHGSIGAVSVEGAISAWILQRVRAQCDDLLREFGRQNVRRRRAGGLRIGAWHR